MPVPEGNVSAGSRSLDTRDARPIPGGEAGPGPFGGGPVGLGSGLGVHLQGEADIGMTEPCLSGADVDAVGYEPGRVGPAEGVKPEARGQPCPLHGSDPDSPPRGVWTGPDP